MKGGKVQQSITIYRRKFEELGVGKADYPREELLDSPERGLEHCHAMLDKMEGFIREDRIDKVLRWLGFVQGCLWSQRINTIAELASHNRKDPE